MAASSLKTDLFAVAQEDPVRDWGGLVRDFEKGTPTLLDVWKTTYDHWKHCYQRFRDCEEFTFYSADENGSAKVVPEPVLRFHRRAILALMSSGEKCQDHLNRLPLEGEEEQERLVLGKRMRVLIDSLRESLDLWHPVNAERVNELRQLAS